MHPYIYICTSLGFLASQAVSVPWGKPSLDAASNDKLRELATTVHGCARARAVRLAKKTLNELRAQGFGSVLALAC